MGVDKIHVLSRAVILHNSQILLCKTTDLPRNFYYLPGGHVDHGESVADTVTREVMEELGVTCQVDRLLGCLEYSFEPGYSSICHNHEYNFVFKVDLDKSVDIDRIESQEDKLELIWWRIEQLDQIDFRAEPLKKLLTKWLEGDKAGMFHSEMI